MNEFYPARAENPLARNVKNGVYGWRDALNRQRDASGIIVEPELDPNVPKGETIYVKFGVNVVPFQNAYRVLEHTENTGGVVYKVNERNEAIKQYGIPLEIPQDHCFG